MANSAQGAYLPLPQSISDSDSEKELSMEPICTSSHGITQLNGNYRKPFQQNYNNFTNLREDIPHVKHIPTRMSSLRRYAFCVSIILCFVPIIVFLWVLPCNDSLSCPIKVSNWKSQQYGIELKGAINLVSGMYGNNLNMVIMYKGSKSVEEYLNNGAIAFLGNNGAVAWNFRQQVIPKYLDCSWIDINGNGIKDCIILDELGLKVIGSISGEVMWHAHSHEEGKVVSDLDLPIKLPDLNGDNINDLLVVYQQKNLLLICGKTGKALLSIKQKCLKITDLFDISINKVGYSCENDEFTREFFIKDLESKYKNKSFEIEYSKIKYNANNKDNETIIDGKKIIVKNKGVCPHCSANIVLLDSRLNKELISWPYENAYVMRPKQFSFKGKKIDLASFKGHTNGFVLKIWQWPNDDDVVASNKKSNETFKVNSISELIVLITFNNTSPHIFNTSISEITQLCFFSSEFPKQICQPDLKNQENSLLVGDLDQDGTQELISYSSSYIFRDGSKLVKENWLLISNVTLIHLEEELPKLYQRK